MYMEIMYGSTDELSLDNNITEKGLYIHTIAMFTTCPALEAESESSDSHSDKYNMYLLVDTMSGISRSRLKYVRQAMG